MATMTEPPSSTVLHLPDDASEHEPEPELIMSKIPDWLLTHPELLKRGITVNWPLQPVSTPPLRQNLLRLPRAGLVYGI